MNKENSDNDLKICTLQETVKIPPGHHTTTLAGLHVLDIHWKLQKSAK